MESSRKIYGDAVAAAKKLLGKDGELPKPRVDLLKTLEEGNKIAGALWKAAEELDKAATDHEMIAAKVKTVAKQIANQIDGDNFGLDAKDPNNKKIIASATKIMLDALTRIEDNMDEWSDRLDKLDKMLHTLGR